MSISDKLTTIAQNEQEINNLGKRINQIMFDKDASLNETANNMEQLNNTMESILYGDNGTEGDYYNLFWDNFQDYGNRRDYQNMFGKGWNDAIFKPKYDIIFGDGYQGAQVFWSSGIQNLKGILESQGVSLVTTDATRFLQLFQSSKITNIPTIDMSNVINSSYAFSSSSIQCIDKIISSENTIYESTCFNGASALTHVIFDGVIGTTLNIKWSTKLDTESIVSIIEALSPTVSDISVTLSQTAVNNMVFPITSEKTNTTYNNWNELAGTKTNWTITLV